MGKSLIFIDYSANDKQDTQSNGPRLLLINKYHKMARKEDSNNRPRLSINWTSVSQLWAKTTFGMELRIAQLFYPGLLLSLICNTSYTASLFCNHFISPVDDVIISQVRKLIHFVSIFLRYLAIKIRTKGEISSPQSFQLVAGPERNIKFLLYLPKCLYFSLLPLKAKKPTTEHNKLEINLKSPIPMPIVNNPSSPLHFVPPHSKSSSI